MNVWICAPHGMMFSLSKLEDLSVVTDCACWMGQQLRLVSKQEFLSSRLLFMSYFLKKKFIRSAIKLAYLQLRVFFYFQFSNLSIFGHNYKLCYKKRHSITCITFSLHKALFRQGRLLILAFFYFTLFGLTMVICVYGFKYKFKFALVYQMAHIEQIKNVITSLPPSFQSLSSFQFGRLIIQLNIEELQQLNIQTIQFEFLAGKSTKFNCSLQQKLFQFPIKTSLWHFYHYLKDMDSLKVTFQDLNMQNLQCLKKIQLFSTEKVMAKSYLKGSYIANSVQLCDIFDKKGQSKGYVMVKAKLEFDQQIHKQIAGIIDFRQLLNNPQEEFKQITSYQGRGKQLSKGQKNQLPNKKTPNNQQNMPNFQNLIQSNFPQVKHMQEQQSRMVEDDIDRMISQMQNKPYDSSRYLDNGPQTTPSKNSFLLNTQEFSNSHLRNNFHLGQSSTSYHGQKQILTPNQIQSQNTRGNSNHSQKSISQNQIRKYPNIPLPTNSGNNFANSTIYSQRSVSPGLNSRNRSLSRTQQTSFHKTMKNSNFNGSIVSKSANVRDNQGSLKIQVHQLLGRNLQDEGLNLRVFINDDYEDIFNCKGQLEGQVIVYNQKAEVSECILNQIYKIRFELQNWQGQVVYSSEFAMDRLLNIPKLEGIFMMNFHPHSQQFYGNSLIASQSVLKKIHKPPSQKTLRITVSFSEQIQIIQLYLNLSKFSLNFQKCKYKIPFTKQTVQFEPTQSHFNIFPHSKVYTKLMIQFWDDNSILGVSEVNLQNLKKITKNILECNVEPIYLYDSMFPIKNLFNHNQVGKFKILVCCGNVRQIQHVLNKNMQKTTVSTNQLSSQQNSTKRPVQVEYNQKLGIYIKDRKTFSQVQIQAELKEVKKSEIDHKQNINIPQQSHQVSMVSENQFLAHNLQQNGLSKAQSMKLSQQQDLQSESDMQETEIRSQQVQKKIAYNKKQAKQKIGETVETVQNDKINKPKEAKKQKVLPEKVFKSLSAVICSKIEQSFRPLTENRFCVFQELKLMCRAHLLFNFIDIDILIKCMIQIGISRLYINRILQILQPLNGMINFNLLNDFMMSVQIEGSIKQSLLPIKLFVKLALQQYYQASCLQVQNSETEVPFALPIQYGQWLSDKILSQVSTLDESIDFNEIRKLFSDISLKISLSEYNILKKFLQNQNQIKSFLFDLAQSKASYEQMIKSHKNIYQMLKLTVIQEIINKEKEKQLSQKYQQSVLDKLYGSKFYDNLNESKLSNSESLLSSRVSQKYGQNEEYAQKTTSNALTNNQKSIQQFKKQEFQHQKSSLQYKALSVQDQDDFIINGLNEKPKIVNSMNKQAFSIHKGKQVPKIHKGKQDIKHTYKNSDSEEQNFCGVKVNKFKQKQPSFCLTKTGQTVMSYPSLRKITLTGLQNCKQTYECQLDLQLQSPYIKVLIESPYERKIYFKQSDKSNCQQFQVKLCGLEENDEQIQGQILLNDITSKGDISIAAARFVVIKGIRSVYAVKTFKEEAFCGLVNIMIE